MHHLLLLRTLHGMIQCVGIVDRSSTHTRIIFIREVVRALVALIADCFDAFHIITKYNSSNSS